MQGRRLTPPLSGNTNQQVFDVSNHPDHSVSVLHQSWWLYNYVGHVRLLVDQPHPHIIVSNSAASFLDEALFVQIQWKSWALGLWECVQVFCMLCQTISLSYRLSALVIIFVPVKCTQALPSNSPRNLDKHFWRLWKLCQEAIRSVSGIPDLCLCFPSGIGLKAFTIVRFASCKSVTNVCQICRNSMNSIEFIWWSFSEKAKSQ